MLLAGRTDIEIRLRHVEKHQLEGTYSADIHIVDLSGNYLPGIECSLRESDTFNEVAAWTSGESAFHIDGLEYRFDSMAAEASSKHYMLYFKYQNGKYRHWYSFTYTYYDQLNGRDIIEEYIEVSDEDSPLNTATTTVTKTDEYVYTYTMTTQTTPAQTTTSDIEDDYWSTFVVTSTSTDKSQSTTTVPAENDGIIYGDANSDGKINMADAVYIMRSVSNPGEYVLTPQQKKNADVIGNDGVTNNDAFAIQQYEAGIISSLPVSG